MRNLLLLLLLCLFVFRLSAQTTITLRPDAVSGKDALLDNKTANANSNYGTNPDFAAWAWTGGGNTTARSLIQFDFSSIPSGATITDARLSLYCNTSSSVTQLQSGANASYLQRVTSSWDENIVTWNNQPSTTPTNQVDLAQSSSQTQDYVNIDVTALVTDMQNNPTTSFGFLIKLQVEATYRTMLFASSDHPDPTKRPVLTITYTVTSSPCINGITIQPNAIQGKDALLDNKTANVNSNYGTNPDFAAWAWTGGGNTTARSLIQFDFSGIPSNAIISDARLSLYCNTGSSVTQLQSGANASYLQRITSSWGENSVTWNNQPTTTSTDQVLLPQSSSQTQDYLDIDVKNMVTNMINNPSSNYGFMIKLQTESVYRTMLFASSDHPDSTKRPKLFICYSIPTGMSVLIPNGGEKVLQNKPYTITWSSSNITNINIQYSSNNGFTWNTIEASYPASSGSYLWNVPNITSPDCKIRIRNVSDLPQSDMSNSTFSIVSAPVISLTSPNVGEIWLNNASQNITWSTLNSSKVKLEYTINDSVWVTIADNVPSSLGTYSWNLAGINSNKVVVRITDKDFPGYGDSSNGYLTIRNIPAISVIAPNGGEIWLNNTSQNITWTATYSSKVKLEYTVNDSVWITIADSVTSSPGVYSWNLAGINATKVKVRITDKDFPGYGDQSNAYFTIRAIPVISVIAPNGGEIWFNNSSQNITWDAAHSSNVKLEYTINDSVWITIADHISSSLGTYSWNLAGINSNKVIVRITDKDFTGYGDSSNSYFTIRNIPVINVVSPNGGETWYNNATKNISWTSSYSASVNISYTTNDSAWNMIATNVSAVTGVYAWSLPSIHSTSVKVKIIDADFINYSDKSDATFSIMNPKTIIVNSPNGGETWFNNSANLITWTSANISAVSIKYSLDNGTSWNTIGASGSNAAGGSYAWNIPPSIISTTAKIKILDGADSAISDQSDAPFSIKTNNTGVAEMFISAPFTIYPNPASGVFYLNIQPHTAPYSIRIFDLKGQLLEEKINIVDDELMINSPNIINHQGIYFIELESNDTIYRKKIAIL